MLEQLHSVSNLSWDINLKNFLFKINNNNNNNNKQVNNNLIITQVRFIYL